MTARSPLDASTPAPLPSAGALPLRSIRILLLGLVLTCLIPGVVGVGVLIHRMYEDGRQQIENNSIQTARAMVKVVDGQIEAARHVAIALSTSSFIAAANWAAFHRRARELIKSSAVVASVVVGDASGQQLVNTVVPWGTPLLLVPPTEESRRFFATGRTIVTPVFVGARSGKPRFAVVVPAMSGSRVAYSVGISTETNQLAELLRQQELPAQWVSSISDGAICHVA